MKKAPETVPHTPDDIVAELQTLVEEAEKMALDSAPEAGNGVETLHDRFDDLRERFGSIYADARKTLAAGAQGTDDFVRAKPDQSLAIALGVGVALGLVLSRRK